MESVMRICLRFLSFMICMSSVLVLLQPGDSLAGTCEKWVARVVSVEGIVQVKRAGETQWQLVKLDETYCPGDVIQVQKRSRADVALVNQPVLRLDQNTVITLGGLKDERTSIIALLKGAAHFFSRVTRGLEVQTAFVNAGVEGTEFFIRVEEDKTVLSIFEGKVLASNAAGSLAITSGQSAVAEAGKAPVPRVVVRPRDAVQWALYYPPIIYYRPAEFQSGAPTDWQTMIRKSIEFYWKGDLSEAFSSIEEIPRDIRDPRFLTYRASLLLTVGRVDEAGVDIERALSLDPKNSNVFALQSIIAVAQNEKDKALVVAKKAVEADPNSPTARIALSYAQQANFDLEGALNSLKDAVKLGSENALAWARLSELWLSFGRLDAALKAAKKAVALNPNLSRTQTVLGFAYLTQVKTRESKDAFQKAIELDNADPLPRLGLGLSKIREGNLNEGAREIEIAASLDPDNALIRSYLGKAYYEEKRDKQASEEYTMAEKLDPLDPTSFFYDAIHKQTTNRPVEALHDLQKAIELNDNRAVYRSELLLDSDLAARSASLARIYSDLGFQQLALVEGWKSVNTDPSDFSGHRFLADSYSVLPRQEIARVSELLQSQLLQPLNMTPIQPRLAESNLFLISAGGPGALSFNEFNPLFNRDGITLQASGLVGSEKTSSEEAVLSGIYKKASFSLGYTHFQTDGWRPNAHQNDNIADAFLQLELSPQTSVQAEYRYRHREDGDLELRFLTGDFRTNYEEKEESNTMRIGLRHAFSPDSIILGSFMYQRKDFSSLDMPTDPSSFITLIDSKFPSQKAFSSEIQHLFRSKYVNLTSGIGYFHINAQQELVEEFDPALGIDPYRATTPENVRHKDVYLYSYIKPIENLTFTLGASCDFFDTDSAGSESRNQFNPKFGITWNPLPNTTLRAAVFRVLKRTLITDQTLEPTQVAGFNQFFDDFNSTESWRYGVAVDQKFSQNINGGAEYSYRRLNIPFQNIDVDTGASEVLRGGGKEYLGHAYLLWTPHPWLALSVEYQYERITNEESLLPAFTDVKTQRVPLGLRFFHPSGWSASLKATHISQDGDFSPRLAGGGSFEHGQDDFWLVDAAINYRLPKRYGFISVGATNLFNKNFLYQETDIHNPSIHPGRFTYAKVTLAFP
jgi:tetratricopeptide (TPR) repeat protein